MRQASAAIGVATANMLPQLTLTGAYGGESLKFASLFMPGSAAWNVAAGVTQPLFEGYAARSGARPSTATIRRARSTGSSCSRPFRMSPIH